MPGQATTLVLPLADSRATLETVGGKGASLARLAQAGLPVPPAFYVTTEAYRRFVADSGLQPVIDTAVAEATPDAPASLDSAATRIRAAFDGGVIPAAVADAVRAAYTDLGEERVAVRSSATAEDLPGLSFAGQQETYLNIRGSDAVLAAVQRCWSSLWTARAIGYRARQDIASDSVSLAVVVQALVPSDSSGILFTANPVSGARGELVIDATWGLGEAIVGGLVTPDTYVVDTATGHVTSRVIADKAVMTVRRADGTHEVDVPMALRQYPVLDDDRIEELARLGSHIEALYGQPMDIEWAHADGQTWIVQARPITALPRPADTPPVEWPVPHPHLTYARSGAIELMPDPLSPLFASLGLPAFSRATAGVIERVGIGGLLQGDAITTVNDYAYYQMDISPRQAAGLLRAVRLLPDLVRTAESRWANEGRPAYARVTQTWEEHNLGTVSTAALLNGARDILDAAAAYYLTIQTGLLPAAYNSEALFSQVYQRLWRRRGDPPALTFVLGFDSAPIRAEKSLYGLALWARRQPGLANALRRARSTALSDTPPDGVDAAAWAEFRQRFQAHLADYGHTVYNLDFATPVPADDPAPVLEALQFFLSGQAPNPYERQARAIAARQAATARLLARLRDPQRALFLKLLGWAQGFAPLREDGLADVGLGWPVVRRMLREIGRRLVQSGAANGVDDVFWLTEGEVRALGLALDAGEHVPDQRPLVAERRVTWSREHALTPPMSLPLHQGIKLMGVDLTEFMPAQTEQAQGNVIRGIGASPGVVTGSARVLHGPAEFDQMRHGDILVARITTPAWTPLFVLAAGVVTDVGGPLSHSSIVAREYGIPAVLGTGVATERLRSGQQVVVDGDAGMVRVVG